MLKHSHPVLALMLHYWPATIFAPSILLLIAVLVLVTRRWDARDAAALQARHVNVQHSANVTEIDEGPGQGVAAV
jgi:hypothetical protein